MGTRGPQPTPTAQLKMRGSWLAKTRDDEPKPDAECPRCPAWLSPKAKAVWRRVVPQLHAIGMLARVDRDAMERYCATFILWRETMKALQTGGYVVPIRDEAGKVIDYKDRPEVGRVMRLGEQLNRMCREFGLTPAARAGMSATPAQSEPQGASRFFKAG